MAAMRAHKNAHLALQQLVRLFTDWGNQVMYLPFLVILFTPGTGATGAPCVSSSPTSWPRWSSASCCCT
jgi:hypothetical protein